MKTQTYLLLGSICAALAGCVGSGELIAPSAGNTSSTLPPAIAARLFAARSLNIQGLHSSWTIAIAGSPNASGSQSQSSNANYSTEIRPLKSSGILVSGGGSEACYIGSDRSAIYIGYTPGGTKSDSYTCSGSPTDAIKRAYNVSYNSTSSYDGKTLRLDGTLTIRQSIDWNMGRPNEDNTKIIHQTATIQFNGKTCSVETYLETQRETSNTPESSRHYASSSQVDTEIRKQSRTKCIVY